MPVITTDAIVLHAFDYLESSRIFRFLTREGGVRSVLARGARRSSRRFGTALDLFAQGSAQLEVKPGRDLDGLVGFDLAKSRPALAADLGRFTGASALAELTMRFGRDDTDQELFEAVVAALDALAVAPAAETRTTALAGGWRVLSALGFAPTLERCADCHAELADDAVAPFSHPAGGVLCGRCARGARAGRLLPPSARVTLRVWLSGAQATVLDDGEVRAHQRLLHEFVREHLADDRPLRAFDVWQTGEWSAA